MFFGVNNYRNTWPLKLIFVLKHWEFNVDTTNVEKVQQEINDFLDNLIWIGNGIFSLLLREY